MTTSIREDDADVAVLLFTELFGWSESVTRAWLAEGGDITRPPSEEDAAAFADRLTS